MQKQFETYKERVPSWALCYIVNGDIDGLTDEEIEMINNWLNVNDYEIVSPVEGGEEYFSNSPLTEIHLITGEIGICSLLTGQAGHFEIPRVSYQTSKGNVVLFPDEVMPVNMELLQQQINDGYVLLGDGRYLPPKETVEACYNAFGARVGLLDNWERTYNSWIK